MMEDTSKKVRALSDVTNSNGKRGFPFVPGKFVIRSEHENQTNAKDQVKGSRVSLSVCHIQNSGKGKENENNSKKLLKESRKGLSCLELTHPLHSREMSFPPLSNVNIELSSLARTVNLHLVNRNTAKSRNMKGDGSKDSVGNISISKSSDESWMKHLTDNDRQYDHDSSDKKHTLKKDGSNSSNTQTNKSCTCSFCVKAASIWVDICHEDAKDRLSALKKSKKQAKFLARSYDTKGIQEHPDTSKLESDLMHQWKSLFLHTEDTLALECNKLESNNAMIKKQREDLMILLELTNKLASRKL